MNIDLGRVTPIFRGDYDAAVSYELNDVVLYSDGNLYWHTKQESTTGVAPTVTETWTLAFSGANIMENAKVMSVRGTIAATEANPIDIDTFYGQSGMWYSGPASTPYVTHAPWSSGIFSLFVKSASSAGAVSGQVQIAITTGGFACRRRLSGAWSDWFYAASAADVDRLMTLNPILSGTKKIVGLGGSFVKQVSGSSVPLEDQWFELVASMLGMTSANYGAPGSSIAPYSDEDIDSLFESIDAILAAEKDAEYFVLQGGGNDSSHNVPIGETDSTTSTEFCGALNLIIDKIRAASPRCKILCITCFHRWNNDSTHPSTATKFDVDYANAMVSVCKARGVPVFDAWHDSGIVPRYNMSDPADSNTYWPWIAYNNKHFNIEGNAWIAPVIAKRIEAI